MDCNEIRQILLEQFGRTDLPEMVGNHLKQCPQCTEFNEQLLQQAKLLAADNDFFPTASERDSIHKRAMSRLGRQKSAGRRWPLLMTAASVILIAGLAYVAKVMLEQSGNGGEQVEIEGMFVPEDNMIVANQSTNEQLELFIYELKAEHPLQTEELLSNDLTEDEFNYLDKNLTVGGLL